MASQSSSTSLLQTSSDRRFGGIARLYGEAGLERLRAAHVCVVGIGGVGSWAVESLARSAVGAITMIDLDVVAESNINRQLVATEDTIGRDKVLVMRDRVVSINPVCEIHTIDDFLTSDNVSSLIGDQFDYVIDCIDDCRTKAALIHYCRQQKIRILTVGGAGGQIDPSLVRRSDLSNTQHDVLLSKTRKILRQDYGFARNPKRTFGVPCVYSDEQLTYPDGNGGISAQRPTLSTNASTSNALNCAGGMGSITHVTASFAFAAAGFVLNELAHAR